MESTHDLDFMLWCLEPAQPARVYSQVNYGAMREASGADVPDTQWITVTMDTGLSFVVGGGWSLPLGYPNFSTTWIEMVGTEGVVMVDDSHRDVVVNTMAKGMQLPMSTMPGEAVAVDRPHDSPVRRDGEEHARQAPCHRRAKPGSVLRLGGREIRHASWAEEDQQGEGKIRGPGAEDRTGGVVVLFLAGKFRLVVNPRVPVSVPPLALSVSSACCAPIGD
jgi:predicted dehydrogenase